MSPNIDLKRLRAFLLVAKNGSLRHAASVLRVSIPAISIQIRQLEEELGVELFQRFGRRLVLTPTGQVFLAEAEKALEAFNHAIESVSPAEPKSGRLSLAMNNDLARHFSAEIARFMRGYPKVDLSLRVRGSLGTLGMVMDGDADIGVGYFSDVPPEIRRTVIGKSGFSLVCHTKHPLAKRRRPTLEQIGAYRIITLPTPTNMGRRIAGSFSAAGVTPMGVIEAGNCQTSREFAEKGIGVAIIPHRLPRREMAEEPVADRRERPVRQRRYRRHPSRVAAAVAVPQRPARYPRRIRPPPAAEGIFKFL